MSHKNVIPLDKDIRAEVSGRRWSIFYKEEEIGFGSGCDDPMLEMSNWWAGFNAGRKWEATEKKWT